ncbi:hypothetical protein VNO77_11996 [Canavalia gladiata]|uniref:Translation initiation factor 3 N-terminal domain-containing protein n=1 Tax=Canavalia gladiata TaxID=3824 RepID=A0AAN9LWD0_CANGL
MAFWHRIGKHKLKNVCIQFHRCYIHLPHASSFNSAPKPCPFNMPQPYSVFHGRPTTVFDSVRFYAAPIQVKTKKEEEDTGGLRLNDQIRAPYVRLVVDDGHSIISRFEALERAKKLRLDLVEVQKNANPPVCKIMDFHKETYKRQEREKERAKSKPGAIARWWLPFDLVADMKLRKECKEVRFSEKTEAKDLKMKADMVKKLMEKGYRVKCKVSGKENQDLTGLLSRLLDLIEDVCIVESGPHMAKKDAFMIVRHIKYGLSKKGGRKLAVTAQEGNMETADSNDSIEYESNSESGFETEEEVLSDGAWSVFSNNGNIAASPGNQTNAAPFPSRSNDPVSPDMAENRYRRADHRGENKAKSDAQVAPAVTENRYRRVEPRNRFQQTASNNTGMDNRGPGIRDAARSAPSNWNQTRHAPVNVNVNPKIEHTKQGFAPGSRHPMPSHENIPRHHPNAPNTPRPGYGNFRSPNEGIPKHNSYGVFSPPKGPETQGNSQYSTWQQFSQESQ